jgi:glycine cleavage system H protein
MIKFSSDHHWIDASAPEAATIGITVHAQEALGDIVFVQLPEIGQSFAQGSVVAVVESVKTAADVFMPASGQVLEVNTALKDDPSLANTDPLGAGWLFKASLSQVAELEGLMDAAAYADFCGQA